MADTQENEDNKLNSSILPVPPPPPFPLSQFNGKKISFSNELNDLDEVSPNIYIGSWQAACDVELLKKLNIRYVLTIEDTALPDEVQSQFVYKFKKLQDSPYVNILALFDECFEFIESAMKTSDGILVHW